MVISIREVSARPLGGLLDRRRVMFCCGALLGAEILVSMFLVAGTYGLIVPLDKPNTTDFVSFYAAGMLADAGTSPLVYDHTQHHAAEERATEAGIKYNFFNYPPVFLLVCAALGHLPYLTAFVIFEVATLVLYLLVVRGIFDEDGWAVLLPVVAFPAVFWNFGFGQNAFLTAVLFGAGTLYIDRRPLFAGILFGALCYKPHFGLLVPVALAAGGHWRAFASAFCSAVALCLVSLAFFGSETWHAFIMAAAASTISYASGHIPFSGYVNPFGAVRQLGGPENVAYAVQAGTILAAAALVAFVWRRALPLSIRAATLASATLVAAPLAIFYDLMLAAVAALWLLRGDGKHRLLDWEKIALAWLFLLSLSPRTLAEVSHLPIGPCIALGLAAMVAARALRGDAVLHGDAAGRSIVGPANTTLSTISNRHRTWQASPLGTIQVAEPPVRAAPSGLSGAKLLG
jgi:alpha-1,2-mannosyltransferase